MYKFYVESEFLELKKSTSVEGSESPYFAFGKAYLRVADEDRQLTSNEHQKIILAKALNALPWDAEAPEKNPYSINEIVEKTMKVFIESANTVGRIDFPFTNKIEILKKLKLISGDFLTNAAVTLFGGELLTSRWLCLKV